jgi:excisionase family DNA binding protein
MSFKSFSPGPQSTELWRTQRVAQALGLSVSTVKRLVDAGEISAARTPGSHRLIPVDEALRYARLRNLPVLEFERQRRASTEGAPTEQPIGPKLIARAVTSLSQGDLENSRRLLRSAVRQFPIAVVGDDLIRPVMEQIGHGWQMGELTIYREHTATRLVESVLLELIQERAERDRQFQVGRPLALGCASEDDPYSLSGMLCELLLQEFGWRSLNFGVNLPLSTLAEAIVEHRPRLAWITVNHLEDPQRFVREYRKVSEAAAKARTAVMLGGHALGSAIRGELHAAVFAERLTHLAELVRQIDPILHARPGESAGVPNKNSGVGTSLDSV